MPLMQLKFKPGINRDITDYAQEGGWYACNKVRFLKGYPKKIGGWTRYTVDAFVGICRSLFSFSGISGTNFAALGTSKKVYLDRGGSLVDITPIRLTTSGGDPRFTAVNGSAEISVAETGHGATAGDYVTFSSAASLGGNITAAVLNQEYVIDSITSANAFKFTATATANSSDSSDGGGSTVAAYQTNIGNDVNTEGYGWGVSTYGSGTWGTPRSTPVFDPARLIYFTRYQDDLLFNYRYGSIYRWVFQTSPSTRAVLLSASPSSGTEVPTEVTQVLIAQDNQSNIILALGCTPYPASDGADRDPLLIRWSDITNPFNFSPSDTTTAGSLTVQNGSQILKGVPTSRETLVFTESSLNSLKFVGGFDVFRLDEISANTTLIAPNAVITADNITYWMGLNKFYAYTGGQIKTLDCTVSEEVFKNYNTDQTDQYFAGLNSEFHEIWWFYCALGSTTINRYVVYNYVENVWFYGDCDDNFDRTAWSDAGVRPTVQAASDDGYIYDHEVGNNAANSTTDHNAMSAFITSAQISMEAGERFVLLQKIIPDVDFTHSNATSDTQGSTGGVVVTPTVDFSVIAKKNPGAATYTTNESGETLTDAVTAVSSSTIDQFTQQAYMRARGRSMAFKVESSAKNVAWELGVPRAEVRPDGRRG